MSEGAVVNLDQQITEKRRNQFYVIADYKNTDGSVKRARLHIKYVVAGPVLVPVPVNLPETATILIATTTTSITANLYTNVTSDPSTTFDPAPVPTTTITNVAPELLPRATTIPTKFSTTFAPPPDPKITTTTPDNTPTPVIPEPDTTTTTCIFANSCSQN